ncbi:MAG: pyridoxal phosphate-dependent aminotransferase family protein [Eudoraea sp.]|nr:pyridoxal phosphate-dependent aminotransferase family protein [Eudoraea sp.]
MEFNSFYNRFQLDTGVLDKIGFNPYYLKVQSGLDDILKVEGSEVVDLASNNYLGLANDKRIKDAVKNAVKKYGASMCATPIALGFSDLYERMNRRLASFAGVEQALIYPSGYQANNGIFSAVTGKNDVIIIDQYAHSSLIEGARATGCKIRPFLHNKMASLEKNLLHSSQYQQKFVVTESVFSTEGSIAPFNDIVNLCRKYNAIPVIDDSHGIGVLGNNGKGVLEHFGMENYPGIYTASLGKSLASLGGMVGGRRSLMNYLKYYSSHLVYSTALPPHVLAGLEECLSIIDLEFGDLSARMWSNRNRIRDALIKNGYKLADAEAPIVSVQTGETENTLMFAKNLFMNGIISTPFVYPSVPKGKGIVRLIAGANLSEEALNRVILSFREIKENNTQ